MGTKYRQMIGRDPTTETAEREIDRATMCVPCKITCPSSHIYSSDKERELRHLESESTASTRKLQQLETTLANLNSQMKSKQGELRGELRKPPGTPKMFLNPFDSLRNQAQAAPYRSPYRRNRPSRR